MNQDIKDRYNKILDFIPTVSSFLVETQSKPNFEIFKKGEIDLVTEADKGSEEMIKNFIFKHFPKDSILAEESGAVDNHSTYKWIIDPVDGTTNFAHRLPLYAVSIGIENTESKELVVGVVALPALNEVYHGYKDGGAYKNKKQIHVSTTDNLQNALFCTGFPYQSKEKIESLLEKLKQILIYSRGVRRTGTASLDLCWVAEGRFDGFWEEGLNPWDTAGPCLLIQEAGGNLSTYSGDEYNVYIRQIIASNPKLHPQIVEIFKSIAHN